MSNKYQIMYQRNHIEQDQCQSPENASQIQLRQEIGLSAKALIQKMVRNKSNPFSQMIFNMTKICGTCFLILNHSIQVYSDWFLLS